jgi:hypothetical protein
MGNINTDRQWFKSHRETNFRIRRGSPAEIEKIACRVMGAVPDGFASCDFDEEREWRVLVIDVGSDTLVRMPILRPKDEAEGLPDSGSTGIAIVFGQRIVMDKIAGRNQG